MHGQLERETIVLHLKQKKLQCWALQDYLSHELAIAQNRKCHDTRMFFRLSVLLEVFSTQTLDMKKWHLVSARTTMFRDNAVLNSWI